MEKVTRSGAIVFVDAMGRADFFRCSWLVRVPTFHPEPDFPEDTYKDVDCGAICRATPGGYTCDAGHTFRGLEVEWAETDWERHVSDNFDPALDLSRVV